MSAERTTENVNPQTEAETVAAETSDSLQTDVHPISAESTDPELVISPQNQCVPEGPPQSPPDTPSQIKRKVKQKASPKLDQPQCQISCRQFELEEPSSLETYGKKLRSCSTSVEKLSLSPESLKKTKSTIDSTIDPQPSKKARVESVAAIAESQQGECEEAAVPETPQTGLWFLCRQLVVVLVMFLY